MNSPVPFASDLRRRPVVLYVEDHAVNLLLMRALFERRPQLELVCATSGYHARALAPELSPVLLLLDLRLPDCHGSLLLPQLRQFAGCREASAVAVTADSDFDITGTGFCELWTKPLDLRVVLGRLDALTGSVATGSPVDTVALPAGARQASVSRPMSPSWA